MDDMMEARKALNDLAKNPKRRKTRPVSGDYSTVIGLMDEIEAAMRAGYTVAEIREALAKNAGFKSCLATLRRYIGQVRHDRRIKGE